MWLLLDTDRKSYTGSPTAPLHLTLHDLEKGQIQGHQDFKALYLVKEPS